MSDTNNHRMRVFDSAGNPLFDFGSFGNGPGQFNNPESVVVDDDGRLAVVDRSNARVQVFEASGAFLATFGTAGAAPGQFSNPYGVAADGNRLIVGDQGNDRVQILDPAKQYPGTNEALFTDYVSCGVTTRVGGGSDAVDVHPGDLVTICHSSPGQFVGNGPVLVVASTRPTGLPFANVFSGLYLNNPTAFLIVSGSAFGNPYYLPPVPLCYAFSYLGGFGGTSALIQCLVLGSVAANGVLASTDGLELRFQ